MKSIKYLILLVLSFLIFPNVYADNCSYKEQTTLNTDLSNIKIIYEIVGENQINIVIYNLTENLRIVYNDFDTDNEKSISYYDTNNGKYILERNANNLEEYNFEIQSNLSNCYGNILSTKKIIKPKYNQFSELSICENKDLQNHTYCQKYITQEIKKSEKEVIQTLNDFLNAKVGDITTQKADVKNNISLKDIIIYSLGVAIVVAVVVVILLVHKKRSEL